MAQNPAGDGDQGYFRGHEPWSYRTKAVPQQTWCGTVVYKRKKPRFWTLKDVARVMARVQVDEVKELNFVEKILAWMRDMTERMMGTILPYLDDKAVTQLYDIIHQMLIKIFNVQPTIEPSNQAALDIIYALALRAGYDVELKRKG